MMARGLVVALVSVDNHQARHHFLFDVRASACDDSRNWPVLRHRHRDRRAVFLGLDRLINDATLADQDPQHRREFAFDAMPVCDCRRLWDIDDLMLKGVIGIDPAVIRQRFWASSYDGDDALGRYDLEHRLHQMVLSDGGRAAPQQRNSPTATETARGGDVRR